MPRYSKMDFSSIGHVVHFSGGAASYLAAKRVVERFGADEVLLVTADTQSEADDWRSFVEEAGKRLGCLHVILSRYMDIWELAEYMSAIPNVRMGFCSRILKKELVDEFLENQFPSSGITQYFGFDWSEEHRLDNLRLRKPDDDIEAPLMWKPVAGHREAIAAIGADGLPMPMAYQLGLPHNNCLKYGCVKGGHSYWEKLYEVLPDAFARSEAAEAKIRERIGDHSILKVMGTVDGERKRRPMALSELRESIEDDKRLEGVDWGVCGCFAGDE